MMQTNLVAVGDIGRDKPFYGFTHGYGCECDACGNCEPVYAPAAPDVPFPQTMRYECHDSHGNTFIRVDCSERTGVPLATWAWAMAAGCVLWAMILAALGWLVGLVLGN